MKLQTLSRGLRFMVTHPVTILRWAAFCLDDAERRRAAQVADGTEWLAQVADHRARFEEFLDRYHLVPSSPVRLLHSTPQPQSVTEYELYVLGTLCRCLDARTVVEIGTYKGRTTCNIAANLGEGGRVYTFNYTDSSLAGQFVVGEMYRGTPLERSIEAIEADSLHFDFSPWYGRVDLMFVDGNHSLSYVRKDSENAFRCVRPGGIIAWHDVDATHPESTAAALSVCEQHGASAWLIDGTQTLLAVRPPFDRGNLAADRHTRSPRRPGE